MKKRNRQLDVLRGVAILLVIGRHLEMPKPEGPVGVFAEMWFRVGWLGVDLFFVLSGFLIGGLLLSELERYGKIDVRRFLVRRGLKIYPPYFVFIGYLLLMPTAKAWAGGRSAWAAFGEQWSQYWPNLLFLQNYVGSNPAAHTWSLAVEEHFYIVLPVLLMVLIATHRVAWLVPLCAAVVLTSLMLRGIAVLTDDPFGLTMAATHLRLDALLFGVAIRAVAQYAPERFGAGRSWRGTLLLAGIVLWSPNLFVESSTVFVRTIGLTATFVGSAAFLLAAFHTHSADFGRLARHLTPVGSVVAWIGCYSYAIYLWHVTAIGILEREAAARVFEWSGSVSPAAWVVSVLTILIGAVVAGVIATKTVEWPVLGLRDRLFPSRSGCLPATDTRERGPRARQEVTATGRLGESWRTRI